MSFIPTSQFDAKLFLLAHRMQLEVICVLAPFLDYLHQFDHKKTHMMLVLMFDPKFKDLLILSNCMGIEKPTIATRYDSEILIPFLCSTYQKVHLFAKHPSNFGPQEWPLVAFGARLTQDEIVMEHVSFFCFCNHM
jgi:hypothetical protein